jgi:hypothetical protein
VEAANEWFHYAYGPTNILVCRLTEIIDRLAVQPAVAAAEVERDRLQERESYLELMIEAFMLQYGGGVTERFIAAAKEARMALGEKGE